MSRTDYLASVLLALVVVSEIRARWCARKIGVGGVGADGRFSTAPTPMNPSRFDHDYDTDDERWLWFLPPRDAA